MRKMADLRNACHAAGLDTKGDRDEVWGFRVAVAADSYVCCLSSRSDSEERSRRATW